MGSLRVQKKKKKKKISSGEGMGMFHGRNNGWSDFQRITVTRTWGRVEWPWGSRLGGIWESIAGIWGLQGSRLAQVNATKTGGKTRKGDGAQRDIMQRKAYVILKAMGKCCFWNGKWHNYSCVYIWTQSILEVGDWRTGVQLEEQQ